MKDTEVEMFEIDLCFRGTRAVDASSYNYPDKDQLVVKLLDQTTLEKIKVLNFIQVMGEKQTTINYEGLEKTLLENAYGEVLVVEKGER